MHFVRNVESYNAVKFHVFLNRCRQVIISDSYFHDAQNYGTGGHGYGVNLENLSTQILVTNNIFKICATISWCKRAPITL